MQSRRRKPPTSNRKRAESELCVSLTVQLHEDDVSLVRNVVSALSDPAREAEARAFLRKRFAGRSTLGLKALLAAAPLEGIDLSGIRDFGRAAKPRTN